MAKIKIDLERRIGEIDRNIYGNFAEHLGRCIYGGLYEEGSKLSDEDGFRKDVLSALKELRIPVLRWPGGNFVSGYHWEDGIGPKDRRPKKLEWAWNTVETNRFGTDEFIKYCNKLGTEPYICVNLGTGTPEESAHWVEYCNVDKDTVHANMRKANGNPRPYNVKYWGLGNEMYGPWQIGYKNATDYGKCALEAGKMMKWTDPNIKLIACGSESFDWNLEMLRYLYDVSDYISVHIYVGEADYYSAAAKALTRLDTLLCLTNSAIDVVMNEKKSKKRLPIALDEWNVWYRAFLDTQLEENYDLKDALIIGAFLNTFHKYCNSLKMANLAQVVNVIAPVMTSKEGMFKQTIFYPLQLIAQYAGNIALDAQVESETFDAQDIKNVGLLNVSVTLDEKNSAVVVSAVNLSQDKDISADIVFTDATPKGNGITYEVNGKNPDAKNSFSNPDEVKIEEKKISGIKANWKYVFPKHSMTVVRVDV